MRSRWLLPVAVATFAFLVAFAPWQVVGTAAQMGQMTPLDQLSGDDFDKAFLSQMTMHHAMAVEMARPAVAEAAHQELEDLGKSIIESQGDEISKMNSWLESWYGL